VLYLARRTGNGGNVPLLTAPKLRRPDDRPLGRRRYGVNRSKTHIDVMVGTDALEADGIRQSGKRVALVRDGAWQI
jgi:hypothetical protein